MSHDAHEKHCFVAIPYGQIEEQIQHYKGWLKRSSAQHSMGDDVQVVAASTEPTSITTDIFEHLLNDPVAVFDLGGYTAEEPPNRNVMYELGVRHAFRRPSVILAWKDQTLPFDVTDQRSVKIDRQSFYFKDARKLIGDFVANAHAGKFYDPLESLAHRAELQKAAASNDALQTIAAELSNLGRKIDAVLEPLPAPFVHEKTLRTVQSLFSRITHEAPPSLADARRELGLIERLLDDAKSIK